MTAEIDGTQFRFLPHTFANFDTFRCPRQYRLAISGALSRTVANTTTADSATEEAECPTTRGINFEKDVVAALKKSVNEDAREESEKKSKHQQQQKMTVERNCLPLIVALHSDKSPPLSFAHSRELLLPLLGKSAVSEPPPPSSCDATAAIDFLFGSLQRCPNAILWQHFAAFAAKTIVWGEQSAHKDDDDDCNFVEEGNGGAGGTSGDGTVDEKRKCSRAEENANHTWIVHELNLRPPANLIQSLLPSNAGQRALAAVDAIRTGNIIKPDIVVLSCPPAAGGGEGGNVRITCTIADIKSSAGIKRSHRMQIAFYAAAIARAIDIELRPLVREALGRLHHHHHAVPLYAPPTNHHSNTAAASTHFFQKRSERVAAFFDALLTASTNDEGQVWLPTDASRLGVVGPAPTADDVSRGHWRCVQTVPFPIEQTNKEVGAFFARFLPLALFGAAPLDSAAAATPLTTRSSTAETTTDSTAHTRVADIEDIPFALRQRCSLCPQALHCQQSAKDGQDAAMALGFPFPAMGGSEEEGVNASNDDDILADVPTRGPKNTTHWDLDTVILKSLRARLPHLWRLASATKKAFSLDRPAPLWEHKAPSAAEGASPSDISVFKDALGFTEQCETEGVIDAEGAEALLKITVVVCLTSSAAVESKPRESVGGGTASLPGDNICISGSVHVSKHVPPQQWQYTRSALAAIEEEKIPQTFSNATRLVALLKSARESGATHIVVFSGSDREKLIATLALLASGGDREKGEEEPGRGTPAWRQRVEAAALFQYFSDGVAARLVAARYTEGLFDADEAVSGGRVVCFSDTVKAHFALPFPRSYSEPRQLLALFCDNQAIGKREEDQPAMLQISHVRCLLQRLAGAPLPKFSPPPSSGATRFPTVPHTSLCGIGVMAKDGGEDAEATSMLRTIVLTEQTAALEECAAALRHSCDASGKNPCRRGPLQLLSPAAAGAGATAPTTVESLRLVSSQERGAPKHVDTTKPIECIVVSCVTNAKMQWAQLTNAEQFIDELTADVTSAAIMPEDFLNGAMIALRRDWKAQSASENTMFDHQSAFAELSVIPGKIRGNTVDLMWAESGTFATETKKTLLVLLLPAPGGTFAPIVSADRRFVLVMTTFRSDKYQPNMGFAIARAANVNIAPLLQHLSGSAPHPTLLRYLCDGQSLSDEATRYKFDTEAVRSTFDRMLTEEQRKMIALVPQRTVSLLWGPPGTGKSFTLAAMLLRYLMRGVPEYEEQGRKDFFTSADAKHDHHHKQQRAAQTNAAEALRILVVAFTKTALAGVLEKLTGMAVAYDESATPKEVQKGIWELSLGKSVVMFGTVWQAVKLKADFDMLVVDEASQMRTCEALLASTRLRSREHDTGTTESVRIVLAGDMLQLRPIVPPAAAAAAWAARPSLRPALLGSVLEAGLFSRRSGKDEEGRTTVRLSPVDLLPNKHGMGKPVPLPDNMAQLSITHRGQGRDLVKFVGHIYPAYSPNKLIADEAVDRSRLRTHCIDGCANGAQQSAAGELEISTLVAILDQLTSDEMKAPRTIGVITPHRTQRVRATQAVELWKESKQTSTPAITVDTTERHQGAEYDAVIILLAYVSRQFIYDINRLNVAFSRARKSIDLITTDSVLRPARDAIARIAPCATHHGTPGEEGVWRAIDYLTTFHKSSIIMHGQ